MTKAIFCFLYLGIMFCTTSCSHSSVEDTTSQMIPSESCYIAPPVIPSPPSFISPPTQARPLIVIDAGHGGKDLGTEAPMNPAYKEKNLNLITAKLLEGYLKQMGYRTLLTRNNDLFVSLDGRVNLANENNADLFVSVHYNSAPNEQAEGIEIFYFRTDGNKERIASSKRLADAVLVHTIEMTNARSRGVKHGDLAVIRKTKMPAILIEGGFMTNGQEMTRLGDPTYIKTIAWGVASGIQYYLNQSQKRLQSLRLNKK